jgi:hypothetical protein
MSALSKLDTLISNDFSYFIGDSLRKKVDELGYHLVSTNRNSITNQNIGIKIKDSSEKVYNIDAVVANETMQPIILIEYKYIRHKKHNRDKGSWLCTAHNAVRRRYNSVRSSIAVLAGSWSKSSQLMMESHDINLFIIPFEKITTLLKKHDIKFDWGEKDRKIAVSSWNKYKKFTNKQKLRIAEEMIAEIKPAIEAAIEKTLDNSAKKRSRKSHD